MNSGYSKWLMELLFPINCLGCKKPDSFLCSNCLQKIKPLQIQICPICEKAITEDGEVCRLCRKKSDNQLNYLLVAGDYKNELLAQAIHQFKYKFISELKTPLAKILIKKTSTANLPIPDIIIPIPLHPRRQRWRGFNQSELLGEELAKKLLPGIKIPLATNLIKRKKYTPPQKEMRTYHDRQKNVNDVFVINKNNSSVREITGKNILIIDDVITTGATILNVAKELKKCHPKSISCVVLGRQHQ